MSEVGPLADRPAAPDLTVVVVAMEGGRQLSLTVDGLLEAHRPGLDILVVEPPDCRHGWAWESGAGRDGVRGRVRQGRGRAAGRNEGLKWSRADLVAFIDEGCQAGPEWIDVVRRSFRNTPELAAAVGPAWPGPSANGRAPRPAVGASGLLEFVRGEASGPTTFVLRKSTLPDLWSFDEDLGRGTRTGAGDDLEAVIDLLSRGLIVRVLPAAVTYRDPSPPCSTDGEAAGDAAWGAIALKSLLSGRGHRLATLKGEAGDLTSFPQLRSRVRGAWTYARSRAERSWATA